MVSRKFKYEPCRDTLKHYMKIYRLAVSPDNSWLAASDNLGRICVFNLSVCLSQSASEDSRRLSHAIQLQYPVFSMKTVDQLLVCGDSHGTVMAYNWSTIIKKADSYSTLFHFRLFDGAQLSTAGPHEVNTVHYCEETERLYLAGAGDFCLREYDVNVPNKPIRSYSGHQDTVCELGRVSVSSLLSASADGTVRVWDTKSSQAAHVIRVADEQKVSRPQFGRSVSALAVDGGSFMVCGGGVELGIWHLGSYSLAAKMDAANVPHLCCELKADKILTGSMHNVVSQWDHSANNVLDVQGKVGAVYSILNADTVTFTAGNSNLIDVYLNLGYCAFSLDAYPDE